MRIHRTLTAFLIILAACDAGSSRQADSSSPADSTAHADQVPGQALPQLQGVLRVEPVDEATRDPSLVATRDSLLAIVRRRDTTALATFLDPNVRYSFGASDGRRGFFAHWIEHHSLDQLWSTMEDVLTHGGRFQTATLFSAPWTFTALPDSLDAFEHMVVRDADVPVRLEANAAASPIGTLSHTVVRGGAYRTDDWREIRLADQRTAYVAAQQIRSPVDFRIGLAKQDGRWVIQYFVAGD